MGAESGFGFFYGFDFPGQRYDRERYQAYHAGQQKKGRIPQAHLQPARRHGRRHHPQRHNARGNGVVGRFIRPLRNVHNKYGKRHHRQAVAQVFQGDERRRGGGAGVRPGHIRVEKVGQK